MCISVDLPEPDGPVTATNSPGCDVERHAAQRAHLDLADDVGLDEVPDRDDRSHGGTRVYSKRSASIGSRRAAFCAG